MKVFANRKTAEKHVVTIAMERPQCPQAGGSNLTAVVEQPSSLECPVCDPSFYADNLQALQKHIADVHLQPLRPTHVPERGRGGRRGRGRR